MADNERLSYNFGLRETQKLMGQGSGLEAVQWAIPALCSLKHRLDVLSCSLKNKPELRKDHRYLVRYTEIIFHVTVHDFPGYVWELFQTIDEDDELAEVDSKWLLRNIDFALYIRLDSLLRHIRQALQKLPINVDEVKKHRKEFGKAIMIASSALHHTSPAAPPTDPPSISGEVQRLPLFQYAVSENLVDEAVLLYDSGFVCNKELADLAQDPDVKKMLTGPDDSPMAAFLRQVLKKPRSLVSAATIQMNQLLGSEVRGKTDRARSLKLPTVLCESVVLRQQVDRYLTAVSAQEQDTNDQVQ